MSDPIYYIYKITNNITGMSYIGYTERLKRRWNSHKRGSRNRKTYFHRAMKKYGTENFTFETVCCSLDGWWAKNIGEPLLIKQWNTKVPNGYNMTDGGDV